MKIKKRSTVPRANFSRKVKSHYRIIKGKRTLVKQHNRKGESSNKESLKNKEGLSKNQKLTRNLLIGGGSVIGLLGVSAVTISLSKKAYVHNLTNFAKNDLVNISDGLIKDGFIPKLRKEKLTIGASGLISSLDGRVNIQRTLQKDLKDHHVVHFDPLQFFTKGDRSILETDSKLDLFKGVAGRALKRKFSPEAGQLAAIVLAHRKVNPTVKINLVGHSYGAQVVQDSLHILREHDSKIDNYVRVATLGGVNYGIPPRLSGKNVEHYIDKEDILAGKLFSYDDVPKRESTIDVSNELPPSEQPLPFRSHTLTHYWENYKKDIQKNLF